MADNNEYKTLEDQLIALFRSGAPDFRAAEELIAKGADLNAKGRWPGENVLTQILEGYWCSEFGDNIDEMGGAPTTPHELGTDMCRIIRFFLEHGFDVHRGGGTYGAECLDALTLSTFDKYIIDATKILLDAGAENIPCEGGSPKDSIGSEGSFQGTCENNYHKANIFEAVYQIYEAVEQGHPYDGIDSYEAAIGKKIILVLAEQPEAGSVFYPVSLLNFKKENCFNENLYFIYDGGFLRTTQYADFWVDTQLPDKSLVDVSSHFSGMIGSRIKEFVFSHRTIWDGRASYSQPITTINMENGTKVRFSINFGEVEDKDRAAFVDVIC